MTRKITDELYKETEKRLALNGLAQTAIEECDSRALFQQACAAYVGTREVGGNNRGPLVVNFQKTVDNAASAEAWCMAFVQSMIAYVERKLGVQSPVVASEHCMTTWNKTPKSARVKIFPLPGAIIIWQKGSTTSGHTGVVESADVSAATMTAWEGNTESGVSGGTVVRDGGGVYRTKRSMKGTGSMKVVGFLKPF